MHMRDYTYYNDIPPFVIFTKLKLRLAIHFFFTTTLVVSARLKLLYSYLKSTSYQTYSCEQLAEAIIPQVNQRKLLHLLLKSTTRQKAMGS